MRTDKFSEYATGCVSKRRIILSVPDQSLRVRIQKEFSRPLLKNLDRQFTFVLGLTLLLEAIFVIIMAQRPVEEYSQAEIARIQEQFANFIMGEEQKAVNEVVSTVTTTRETGAGAEEESGGEEMAEVETKPERQETRGGESEIASGGRTVQSEEIQRQNRQAAAEARRQSREAISRSVSTKGLLGMLTGTGSAAQGNAVDNVLGGSGVGNGVNRDLDQILSSVDGLQTQGGAGLGGGQGGNGTGLGGVRGSRSGGPTSIDDLVTERSDVATASLSRQGDLVMESPSDDVVGRGNKSAYRSPDAIREVLLGHVPAIRYCYERELKRDPELKGKVSVRITVSEDGYVTAAEIISSSLNNIRVERCMLARIRLWKDFKPINPSDGSVSFTQIYTFGL